MFSDSRSSRFLLDRFVAPVLLICGAALLLSASGLRAQVVTTINFFNYSDGAFPVGPLVQGQDGDLYGTTSAYGALGYGTFFGIDASGKGVASASFNGTNANGAVGGLTLGSDGMFYGTSVSGGRNKFGTVFRVSLAGAVTVLYSFVGTNDGVYPRSPPVQASNGNYYGVTPDLQRAAKRQHVSVGSRRCLHTSASLLVFQRSSLHPNCSAPSGVRW